MHRLAVTVILAATTMVSGGVVIDMPAPKGTTYERAGEDRAPAVGSVALQRYAWARTGPRYTSAATARPGWGVGGYRVGFLPLYPAYGFGVWTYPSWGFLWRRPCWFGYRPMW